MEFYFTIHSSFRSSFNHLSTFSIDNPSLYACIQIAMNN